MPLSTCTLPRLCQEGSCDSLEASGRIGLARSPGASPPVRLSVSRLLRPTIASEIHRVPLSVRTGRRAQGSPIPRQRARARSDGEPRILSLRTGQGAFPTVHRGAASTCIVRDGVPPSRFIGIIAIEIMEIGTAQGSTVKAIDSRTNRPSSSLRSRLARRFCGSARRSDQGLRRRMANPDGSGRKPEQNDRVSFAESWGRCPYQRCPSAWPVGICAASLPAVRPVSSTRAGPAFCASTFFHKNQWPSVPRLSCFTQAVDWKYELRVEPRKFKILQMRSTAGIAVLRRLQVPCEQQTRW